MDTEKKPSTALIQEADVGVKWKTQRPWSANHCWTSGMFVGGVVVGDGVDDFAGRQGAFDGVEELDEFLMGMSGHAAPNDAAVEDVEGGK